MPASQPGLGCGALLVAKTAAWEPGGVALVHCKAACLVAALSHGIFSRELARAAAQEILVAPLLQSLLFGARAGFGLAHILKCLAAFKRMLQSIQGCWQNGRAQSWFCAEFTLSPDPCVSAQTYCSGFSRESSGLRKTWSETGVRAWCLIAVCSFLLLSPLLLAGAA